MSSQELPARNSYPSASRLYAQGSAHRTGAAEALDWNPREGGSGTREVIAESLAGRGEAVECASPDER